MVCDSWLLLEFPLPEAAESLILKASKLRNTWDNLLKLKLEGNLSIRHENQTNRFIKPACYVCIFRKE